MLSHRKILTLVVCTLCLSLLWERVEVFGLPHAYADVGLAARGAPDAVTTSFMSFLGIITGFMQVALLVVLWFAQYLLSPDFFTNPLMVAQLKSVWILSRDIMNVIFAMMLVGVAIYTIVMGNSSKAGEKMVHFILAIILVNFSWFFPRVIIDVAGVMTSAVYSIAERIAPECQQWNADIGAMETCRVAVDVKIFPSVADVTNYTNQNPPYECYLGLVCILKKPINDPTIAYSSGYKVLNGLAVSFARIDGLTKVPLNAAGGASFSGTSAITMSFRLLVSTMTVFLIQLALFAPLLGLTVGLLLRIVILWVTIALMPFTFLGLVVNGKLGTNVFGNEFDVWDEFIKAAFLPFFVALPFTIGFMLLLSVTQVPAPPGLDFRLPIISGVTNPWQLLWVVAATMIIWKGAFMALKQSKQISGVTEKIQGTASTIAGGIAKLPLLTPLPIPGAGNLGALLNRPKQFGQDLDMVASGRATFAQRREQHERAQMASPPSPASRSAAADRLSGDTDSVNRVVGAIRDLQMATLNQSQRDTHLDTLIREFGNVGLRVDRSNVLVEAREVARLGRISALTEANVQRAINSPAPPAPQPGGGTTTP